MGQRLEMFSFFHSMKSLKSASDLQLNQSHHYEIRVGFFGWGGGGSCCMEMWKDNKDVLKTQTRCVCMGDPSKKES